MPYRRYADFSGRSRRKEYWMFALLQAIVALVLIGLMLGTAGTTPGDTASASMLWIGLLVVWGLGTIIPSIAVQVRRFHDQDRSGWMVLIGFIPYIGGLIVLVFMCLAGTRGPNRFGPDPKDTNSIDVFS